MKRKCVPDGLQLKPYQQEGVKQLLKMLKTGRGAILGDEMGLGKTPQFVVLTNALNPQHTVVIAPASVLFNHSREFRTWRVNTAEVTTSLFVVTGGHDKIPPETNIIIISYAVASKPKWVTFLKEYLRVPNSLLICDEAHYLKGWKAKRTQRILIDIASTATKVLPVTGSPVKKAATELHPILSVCQPGKWGTFKEFGYRYSYPVPNPYSSEGVDFRGTRKEHIKELRAALKEVMVRRFKKDVQKELPKVVYASVYLDVETHAGKELLTYADQIAAFIDDNNLDSKTEDQQKNRIRRSLSTFRQQLGVHKLPAIREWLTTFIEDDDSRQFVLYGYHKEVVDDLARFLDDKGLSFATVTGGTSAEDRDKAQTGFHAKKYQVILANIIAGGIGANWQCASYAIFAEPDWDAVTMAQAVKRLDRIGQKDTVNIYFLLAKESIDEHVIKVIRQKQRDINELVGKNALR